MDVAEPTENRWSTCSEATRDLSSKNCMEHYSHIQHVAARCCGGGPSYCPAPQVCEDPMAFDPAAGYEFRCYKIGMPEAECTDKGCYSSQHDGVMYCSCPASDEASCATMLPGEATGTCLSGRGIASRDSVRVSWTWDGGGGWEGSTRG